MRFPLAPNAFALMLCAPIWVAAFETPPCVPPDACATFAESMAIGATAGGRDDLAGPPMPTEAAPVKIMLEDAQRAVLLEEAYKDARDVLARDDECSDFFGGRDGAQHVLGRLVGQLRDDPALEPNIGIVMKGDYTNIINLQSGLSYRLFTEAIVNSRGPFFRKNDGRRVFPDCGSFAPNTRGVRAAMLLHELGHLIQGANGRWLLPNDGNNPMLAERNSNRIEKKCGRQIKALDAKPAPSDLGTAKRARS
ncbi:MAG TPA: hypothetical protein VF240_06245 [Pyrinomonadaceae bacterium]